MSDPREPNGPTASDHGSKGTTFKREGPPAEHDTGRDVEDMNRKAEESLVRNVEPDQPVD